MGFSEPMGWKLMAAMRTKQQPPLIQLPEAWQVPAGIRDRLGTDLVGRQRALVDETLPPNVDSPLLLVLHEVPDRLSERWGIFFWRDLAGGWHVYRQGEPYAEHEDGIAALHEHLARYEEEEHSLRVTYQRAHRAGQYLTILEETALKCHAAANLHRTLVDARTLMRDQKISYDVEIINMRDRAYNIERDFELLYTDTQNALDYREAHAVEILNILLLIFFPLTIIASIFETGIIQQLLDTTPTLDPLVLTLALLIAALLFGVSFYLLVSPLPRRRLRRAKKRRTGRAAAPVQLSPAAKRVPLPPAETTAGVQAQRPHPLQGKGTRIPLNLGKKMAHYQLDRKQK